jgi:CRISPR system Cascade subunit CasD
MATVLLRLAGPLQSWGTTSRFDERDSQLEPSKSGVLGLLCAAIGRDRSLPIDDLAGLRMGLRVDREGVLMRDYQTAGGHRDSTTKTVRLASGDAKNRTVVSPRYYLSDAVFLVGLEGGDRSLLDFLHASLRAPVWPLYLGRKSFPLSEPAWLPNGVRDESLREALLAWPRLALPRYEHRDRPLRMVLEHPSEGSMRMDQPVAPFAARRFGPRFVVSEAVHVPV